jgi:hypothetical protein
LILFGIVNGPLLGAFGLVNGPLFGAFGLVNGPLFGAYVNICAGKENWWNRPERIEAHATNFIVCHEHELNPEHEAEVTGQSQRAVQKSQTIFVDE